MRRMVRRVLARRKVSREFRRIFSLDPIPEADIRRAEQLAKERGWKDISA